MLSPQLRCALRCTSLWSALGVSAVASLHAQTSTALLPDKPLPRSAHLALSLHAGDYEIRASGDSALRVSEQRSSATTGGRTDVRFRMDGERAVLEIDPQAHSNGPHIVIDLPPCAALDLRMTAGELVFDTVVCDSTQVDLHAGEIRAALGDADLYRRVRASVAIGEVDTPGLGAPGAEVEKGGFFRTIDHAGSGNRVFTAHVTSGQITLRSGRQ